jgi:PAS domain S-box-containing protein
MSTLENFPLEQRIRLVFDQLQSRALVTVNLEGTIIDWSRGAQFIFGWTGKEIAGKSIDTLFTPEDVSAKVPQREMQAALMHGVAPDIRWHVRKDGSRFYADGSITALKLDDGSVVGFVKTVRQETAALRLQETEGKFRAMVNATPHMVWSALPDGTGDYFNERMMEFTGVPASQLLGNGWTSLVASEDGATAWDAWTHAIRTGSALSVEFRLRHFSGEYRWVLCRGEPVRDNLGQVTRWMGTNTDIHDQKMAQTILVENEELFRSLVTATSQVLWRAQIDGQYLKDSPSWREFTGQSYQDMKGFGWLDAIHPEDQTLAMSTLTNAIADDSSYEVEYRVKHANGQYHWTLARAVPILDFNGAIREWVGTNTDITAKKQTELALQEARLRLEATLAAGEVGTFAWHSEENRIFADSNMNKLHALTEEEAGRGTAGVYLRHIHPDDANNVKEQVERAVATRQPYQALYRVCLPQGVSKFIHSRGRVTNNPEGTSIWLSGVSMDVTALQEAETALQKREERYQALFNAIEEGFYIIELMYDDAGQPVDYRFIEANPAAANVNGLTDVIGKTLREVVANPQLSWLERYEHVVKTGQPLRFVDYSPTLSRWVDVSAVRLGEAPRHQIALLFSDITASKQNEEELRRLAADLSQANRRQEEFLATLAHELRNPLAPIRTGLELAKVAMDVPAPIAKLHEMMNRQVSHLVHLVDDLLDLARVNSGKIELKSGRYVLQDIVQSAVETSLPLIQEKGHDLVVNVTHKPIWLDADKNRLGQVVSNLLTNAAKYTPEGGKIVLTVKREEDCARIIVADNGIGISEEDKPHLFDMFSQVGRGLEQAQGGLGIGLNLVKRLTEKHGGRVEVSSPGVGQGSTFTVRLPVDQRCFNAVAGAPSQTSQSALTPISIVIADDNREAAEMLKDLLELGGHTVTMAYDGISALAMVKQTQPELAILDIGMPGMNGHQVAELIRGEPQLQSTALAAVTGWGSTEDRAKSRNAGFDYHLAKPVSYDTLLSVIAELRDRR